MDTSSENKDIRFKRLTRFNNVGTLILIVEKRYYLDELIKILGIPRSTYYNWEKTGKVPEPKRDPMSNYRFWTVADIKKIKKVTGRG